MVLKHELTPDGFRKLDEDIIFIAGSQDVQSVREACENEIRLVIDEFAFDSFARPFSYDLEIDDDGMDQSRSMQQNFPKPSDEHCLGVICIIGERIGHPLPSTFSQDFVPGIESWTRPDHRYRLLHPWPDDPEIQRTRLDEGCYPLTGTVFEFLEARGSRNPVWLGVLADREFSPEDTEIRLNRFRFRNSKSHDMTSSQLHHWLQTDYDLQTKAVHNFLCALVKQGIAQHANDDVAQLRRTVRAFVRDEILARDFSYANPYKHLRHYTAEDHTHFYGRDKDSRKAVSLLQKRFERPGSPKTLGIVGVSGCGKSSLLQAGVLSELMENQYRGLYQTVVFRPEAFVQPDGQPRNVISTILALVNRDTNLRISATDIYNLEGQALHAPTKAVLLLEELLAQSRRDQGARLVIGIDQFEEIVDRLAIPAQKIYWDPLIEFVSKAAGSPSLAVVYTLESGRLQALRKLRLGAAFTQGARLELDKDPMSFFTEIIEEPFKQHGYPLSEGVVSKLEENIRALRPNEGGSVAASLLPLIALRLSRLFEKIQGIRPPIPPESRDGLDFAADSKSQGSTYVQVSDLKEEDFDFEAEISRQARIAWRRAGQREPINLTDLDSFIQPFVGIGGEDGAQIQLLTAPYPPYEYEKERRLAESFRKERLLIEVDGPLRLVHEAVIRLWPDALRWFEKRKDYLHTESWMRREAEAKAARSRTNKSPAGADSQVSEREIDAAAEILAAHGRDWSPGKVEDAFSAYCKEIFRHSETPRKAIPTIEGLGSSHANCAAYYGMTDLLGKFYALDPESLDHPSGKLDRKPLFQAAWTSSETVEYLLSKDIDPIARDNKGWPAISATVVVGNEKSFKLLLQTTQGKDLECPAGRSLLHLCAWSERVDMARVLMEDYSFDPRAEGDGGYLPIHSAAEAGSLDCFHLLRTRSDVTRTTKDGRNCLHLAAGQGRLEIVAALLSDPDFREVSTALSDEQEAALHFACRGLHAKVVGQLLSVLDPNQPAPPDNPKGLRPIHLTLAGGSPMILGSGESDWVDVEAMAATLKELLADSRTDPNLPNPNGWRPLALARENRSLQKLLISDARIEPMEPTRPDGPTPLFLAAQLGYWIDFRRLMERTAGDVQTYRDIDGNLQVYRDQDRNTVLHRLVESSVPSDLLDSVLRRVDAATFNVFNEAGHTPLSLALKNRRRHLAKQFLDSSQLALEAKDPKGWTLLHQACAHQRTDWLENLKPYLAARPELWSIPDDQGRRPLDLLRRNARAGWPDAATAREWPAPKTWDTDLAWEPLDAESRSGLLQEVNPIDQQYEIREETDVAAARLPFYDGSIRLVRLRDQRWSPGSLALYYLLHQGEPFRLNGKSPPIHKINARHDGDRALLSLTEENVRDYLRFFCFFVRGEEGPFLIAESADQAEIPCKLTRDEIATVADVCHPTWLNYVEAAPEEFFCSAAVYYSNGIFGAEFKIFKTGMIELMDDEQVAFNLSQRIDRPLA